MGTFNCPPWKSKAWKLFGVLIGWTKSVKKKGLNLYAMNVEKILWTMSNWDCTSIMCTQCSVAKFCKQKTGLSNTRKATVWIQRSRRPTLVIYASTRWIPKPTSTTTIKECIKPSLAFGCAYLEHAKKIKNLLWTTSKWQSIRRFMKMFHVLTATNPLKQDEIWRGIWKMSTRQEMKWRNSNGSHTDKNLNDDPIDNVLFDIVS